jgi:hypothetical protein
VKKKKVPANGLTSAEIELAGFGEFNDDFNDDFNNL